MPEMVRLSVDLPTPLEPSTATISPGVDFQIDAAQHVGIAIAGAERAHVEERLAVDMRAPTFAAAAAAEIGLDDGGIGRDLGRAALPR